MTRNNPSPCARTRARARRTPAALPALAAFILLFAATDVLAQSGPARPVARLVGSTTVRPAAPAPVPAAASSARCASRARFVDISTGPSQPANGFERRAFELVNAERRSRGQGPLVWDAELSRVAREHSQNMARDRNLSHTDRAGRDMRARALDGGVCGWSALAENIAYNQGYEDPAAFAVERWMISPKHRENILRAGFTHAGIGVARAADGSVYFTQVFVTR